MWVQSSPSCSRDKSFHLIFFHQKQTQKRSKIKIYFLWPGLSREDGWSRWKSFEGQMACSYTKASLRKRHVQPSQGKKENINPRTVESLSHLRQVVGKHFCQVPFRHEEKGRKWLSLLLLRWRSHPWTSFLGHPQHSLSLFPPTSHPLLSPLLRLFFCPSSNKTPRSQSFILILFL